MAIIINERSKVIIQGITGRVGRMFAEKMLSDKTPLVGGAVPGKGGRSILGVPIYDSVEDAVREVKANTSLIVVPPQYVKDAALEAIEAGINTIIIYTEVVPIHDTLKIINYAKLKNTMIIGPNAAGVASPGKGNVSDIDSSILIQGSVGIVSRSGTLAYEIIYKLYINNIGISTVACIGGDPIIGTRFIDVLKMFEEDPQTRVIIMLGEIGGTDEIKAAEYIKNMTKPVYAYIAGWSSPPGKRIGHAGAIITGEKDSATYKQRVLRDSGAYVFNTIGEMVKDIVKSF